MRAAIGIISVLLALAVVGLLAKKQLSATRAVVPALQPATATGTQDAASSTVRAQGQQVQQQYQQAIEGLLQARPVPDGE